MADSAALPAELLGADAVVEVVLGRHLRAELAAPRVDDRGVVLRRQEHLKFGPADTAQAPNRRNPVARTLAIAQELVAAWMHKSRADLWANMAGDLGRRTLRLSDRDESKSSQNRCESAQTNLGLRVRPFPISGPGGEASDGGRCSAGARPVRLPELNADKIHSHRHHSIPSHKKLCTNEHEGTHNQVQRWSA